MRVKRKFKISALGIVSFVVLAVYGVSLCVPLVWAFITSFKDNLDYLTNAFGLPQQWVNNYAAVFRYFSVPVNEQTTVGIPNMLVTSVLYALGSAVFATAASLFVAYVVARFRFKFCSVIYTIIIVQMIIPIVGSLPSEIRMAKLLGIYDSILGIYFMKTYVTGLYFLLFLAALKVIPKDFSEAAYMDGAGNLTVMFRIMFPIVSGSISTVVLLNFITFWNDYQTPLMYMPSHPTLAYGLFYYVNGSFEQETSTVPMRLAGCMLMAIPLFLIFICFQKKLLNKVSAGGLK
ncbi:MAG: hypothetical protein DBX59_02370 [Bacillota bacterium]|nr:MAG: hypothetical protein DBX59_02370 [Bacillota bacterium]